MTKPIEINPGGVEDGLHALIQSLSQNEKRYVKMFSVHGSTPKKYLDLFDALAAEPVYDKDRFEQKYAKHSFMDKYLPQNKQFLKRTILKAMRVYHEERSPRGEVIMHLNNYYFLKEKGLKQAAYKELKKARKKAEARQLDHMLLEINIQESRYFVEDSDRAKNLEKGLVQLQEQQKEYWDRLGNYLILHNTYHMLFFRNRKGLWKDGVEQLEEAVAGLENRFQGEPAHKYSFDAQLYFLYIKAILEKGRGQLYEFHQIFKQILELFESANRTEGSDQQRYLKAVSNYLSSCHYLTQFEVFPDRLAMLEEVAENSQVGPETRITALEAYVFFKGVYLINQKEGWEKTRAYPAEVRAFFKGYGHRLNKHREISFSYNCMMIWFFLEEWREMKPWIDHILSDRIAGFNPSAIYAAQVMELIYFFERREIMLLQPLRRAASRKIHQPSHRELLRLLVRVSDAPPMQQAESFLTVVQFLKRKLRNPLKGEVTAGFLEMYYWALSRHKRISILEARDHEGD